MQIYPELVVACNPATFPNPFNPQTDITPNWAGTRREFTQTFRKQEWGDWAFREKPAFGFAGDGTDGLLHCKIVGTSETDAAGATHASVIADIETSILPAAKTAIRNAMPLGVIILEWRWAIKTQIGGVAGRTNRVDPGP